MINKVLISCDLTRIKKENGRLKPFHNIRLLKYFDILSWQINKGTSLPVEMLAWSEKGFSQKIFYEICKCEYVSENSWINVFDIQKPSDRLIKYYGNLIRDSLVIYIEMSDTQKRIHNILGIPYIDISVHPIRYMNDHYFILGTNDRDIFNRMKEYEIDEDQFYIGARLIKTQIDQNLMKTEKYSSLLIGQTRLDRSLISKNKLYSLNDYIQKIKKIAENSSKVYFKPHPYVKDKKLYEELKNIENIEFTNENVYRLLCSSGISRVVGVSSSVLYEAKYFNKKSIFFNKKFDIYDSTYSEKNYVSIGNNILQPSFWAKVILDKEYSKNIQINLGSNIIRASLNDFWSYTEYDPIIRVIKKSNILDRTIQNKNIVVVRDKGYIGRVINIADKLGLHSIGEIIRFQALKLKLHKEKGSLDNCKGIHFITYRPEAPNGGRGGAGAVQTAIKKILGNRIGGLPVKYSFSEKDGVWHTAKNKYFISKRFPKIYSDKSRCFQLWATMVFVFDEAKDENVLYITQDIPTAYALSLMKREYILVIHSQGSRLDEIDTLGEYFSHVERHIINLMENEAILNARKVYFPSNGAKNEFIKSKYKNKSILKRVNFGSNPLYNTLYVVPEIKKIEFIEPDMNVVTFISVGTVTKSKGQDQTFEYLLNLAKNNQYLNIRWFCIGKGPLLPKLVSKYKSIKLKNFKVEFLQKIEYPKVQYLLKISDVYIMLHRKSIFDLATLEAMNNSCMLVLSKCGGNLEFNVKNNVIYSNQPFDFNRNNIKKMQLLNKNVYQSCFDNNTFMKEWEHIVIKEVKEINENISI